MQPTQIVMLLLLIASCAGSIAVDVIYGKKLRALKCGISNYKCWGMDVLYMILASFGCLIATGLGFTVVKRLI